MMQRSWRYPTSGKIYNTPGWCIQKIAPIVSYQSCWNACSSKIPSKQTRTIQLIWINEKQKYHIFTFCKLITLLILLLSTSFTFYFSLFFFSTCSYFYDLLICNCNASFLGENFRLRSTDIALMHYLFL